MSDAPVKTIPTLEFLRERRAEILALAEAHKAFNVRVFGSVARGDATPESDVDFLVNFQEKASLYDIVGLKRTLQELLGFPVDVVEDHAKMRERFRRRVEKNVVIL